MASLEPESVSEPRKTESAARPPAICRHLRSNGMYIFDGLSRDAEGEDYEPSSCWCLHTMKNFGPDDSFVGVAECRGPERSCYEPL